MLWFRDKIKSRLVDLEITLNNLEKARKNGKKKKRSS